MQSPSSLIFLVLLGVWAAYFVQYWVRRRDHVATARSVEQFSTAMRVLERREALPKTDLSEPAPRSYAVHPARAVRPQVMVKRAVAAQMPAPAVVTERVAPDSRVEAEPVRRAAPRRVPPPQVSPSRRVRGLLFLVAVAELLVIVPLVAFSLLPLWALAPAVVAVVGALAFVRSGARTQAALTRAHRRRLADLERVRASAPVTARPVRGAAVRPTAARAVEAPVVAPAPPTQTASVFVEDEVEPATVVEPVSEPAPAAAQATPVAQPAAVAEPGAVAQPVAVLPVDHAPEIAVQAPARAVVRDDVMVPIEVDDDIPLTWDPVPVPRPTYTMKAKAEHPPVPPAAVTPEPAPAVREDDTAYEQRRVAGA